MPTLYELKQNMATIGQQVAKIDKDLTAKAIDPQATREDITALKDQKDDIQARFDVIKAQHDQLEAEQKAKFEQRKDITAGIEDPKQKNVAVKAEFIRAAVQGRAVSEDVKALIALNSLLGFLPSPNPKKI